MIALLAAAGKQVPNDLIRNSFKGSARPAYQLYLMPMRMLRTSLEQMIHLKNIVLLSFVVELGNLFPPAT